MADTYDAQYAVIRDPSGDADHYASLAAQTGGPVLELGCGTGRVLLPIARTGLAWPNLAQTAVAESSDHSQPPFEHEGRMVRRLVEIRRDHVRQVVDVLFRYVEVDSGRELGTEPIAMRWSYRYELEHLLVRAGFVPLRWSSDYHGGPYIARGEIVVVARRA